MILVVLVQSFKRRYYCLKQQADATYVLEFYKDEKKLDQPKGSIFLDSAASVSKGARRGKQHSFEIKMQDDKVYVLAADSEKEVDDCIKVLNKVIQSELPAFDKPRDRSECLCCL
jgi:hypothetical protein